MTYEVFRVHIAQDPTSSCVTTSSAAVYSLLATKCLMSTMVKKENDDRGTIGADDANNVGVSLWVSAGDNEIQNSGSAMEGVNVGFSDDESDVTDENFRFSEKEIYSNSVAIVGAESAAEILKGLTGDPNAAAQTIELLEQAVSRRQRRLSRKQEIDDGGSDSISELSIATDECFKFSEKEIYINCVAVVGSESAAEILAGLTGDPGAAAQTVAMLVEQAQRQKRRLEKHGRREERSNL